MRDQLPQVWPAASSVISSYLKSGQLPQTQPTALSAPSSCLQRSQQLPQARPTASSAASSCLKHGQQLPQARPAVVSSMAIASSTASSCLKRGQLPQVWQAVSGSTNSLMHNQQPHARPAASCAASYDATLGASMSVYE
ncbi:hypothetical protein Dimus_034036 [Dionaea muscipula]